MKTYETLHSLSWHRRPRGESDRQPVRKVLFLIPTLTGGGAERVMVTLLTHLDRSRFKATLAVVDLRGAAFRADIPADVELVDLQATRVLSALPSIVRLVWRLRPQVVFSTLSHLNLALSMVRPLFPRGTRTVARESSVVSENLAPSRFRWLWWLLYRRFYRKHDLVVCQSRHMHDDLTGTFGFPAHRSVIIHNPVDLDKIRKSAGAPVDHPAFRTGEPVFVAAGRLEHEKGFDLLIEAMALLPRTRAQMIILGKGRLEGELRALAQKLGLEEHVHFAGFQTNPFAWFAKADAFVLSSRYEGFPNVVLEALACGTPVIATPAPGGVNELLGNRPNCVVAAAISAPALAEAIQHWLDGSREKVGAQAVAPYAVLPIVSRYEDILQ
jgi:glycosyltransferase involved in cell wall biosynthesis